MKDSKTTVRYLGFKVLFDGSRRFDFSFESADASLHLISVQASHVLFSGPGHVSIQECPGIYFYGWPHAATFLTVWKLVGFRPVSQILLIR